MRKSYLFQVHNCNFFLICIKINIKLKHDKFLNIFTYMRYIYRVFELNDQIFSVCFIIRNKKKFYVDIGLEISYYHITYEKKVYLIFCFKMLSHISNAKSTLLRD